ncbi:hypothetical protein BVC80_9061g77 [Macleaya cordata]|uniref:Uncharacterized protein n=1 Tax=Macleaya cordata TaxID=56857 RepID=A0A200PN55_MACCD|nr:hypothetical protein BVC80_9061g77 [Macleaya cordata]
MATESTRFEDRILETVKWCQERKDPPLIWGMEVSKCVKEAGLGVPSTELGQVLVSNLCFTNNNPSLWKFIDQAISSGLLSSIQILSLLSSRYKFDSPHHINFYIYVLALVEFNA